MVILNKGTEMNNEAIFNLPKDTSATVPLFSSEQEKQEFNQRWTDSMKESIEQLKEQKQIPSPPPVKCCEHAKSDWERVGPWSDE